MSPSNFDAPQKAREEGGCQIDAQGIILISTGRANTATARSYRNAKTHIPSCKHQSEIHQATAAADGAKTATSSVQTVATAAVEPGGFLGKVA